MPSPRSLLGQSVDPRYQLNAAGIANLERRRRFFVTCAQNNTPVDPDFRAAIGHFCRHRKATLAVKPQRYLNPTDPEQARKADRVYWWDESVRESLVESDLKIHEHLALMLSTRIGSAVDNPLRPRVLARSKGRSAIYGHPQLRMETSPAPQYRLPKLVYTTGACTVPNYSDTDAGDHGEFHHSLGGVVVELSGDRFHAREVVWDGKRFHDLDEVFTAKGVATSEAQAIVTGDEHAWWMCPKVRRATYGPRGIVALMRPRDIVRHDVFDSYSISKHHTDLERAAKAELGLGNVDEEFEFTMGLMVDTTPEWARTTVVPSNHHDHLTQWLNMPKAKVAPENLRRWHQLNADVLERAERAAAGVSLPGAFAMWGEQWLEARGLGPDRVRFLKRDESFRVADIELGMHGDRGPNGARGSAANLSRIGTRSVIGHSHSPRIFQGVYQVGTSSVLRLDYNVGPSSWLNTHCLIHANGRRQMVHIIDGRFRA